jgi:hypothetical protein
VKTSLDTTPGVGYVLTEGNTTVQRVRAFHVTDTDIAWLAAHFAPPARRDSTPARQRREHKAREAAQRQADLDERAAKLAKPDDP